MNFTELKALAEILDPEGTEESYDVVKNPN